MKMAFILLLPLVRNTAMHKINAAFKRLNMVEKDINQALMKSAGDLCKTANSTMKIKQAGKLSLILVADENLTAREFGTATTPEKPTLRPAADTARKNLQQALATMLKSKATNHR